MEVLFLASWIAAARWSDVGDQEMIHRKRVPFPPKKMKTRQTRCTYLCYGMLWYRMVWYEVGMVQHR